ncbi:MAG: nitroreductase family protein [Candidatus Aminicenantes bacterium]|nr:nitroreductase family protein [Candidatus Aminicenantes bacterium]
MVIKKPDSLRIFNVFILVLFSIFSVSIKSWIVAGDLGQMKPVTNRPGLTLKETFMIYVKSIQNSDLESLFTTVTDNDRFFFLTSSGTLIDSREGYYKFHEEWFREKDWEMPVELLEAHEAEEYGYASAIFHYKSKASDNETCILSSYFTLIFQKEEDMWKVVADICTPISRYSIESNPQIKYTSEQTYLFDIVKNRRTVCKFIPTPVPREHILKILDAARFAPTAGNQQPWKFLVIQNREKLDKLQNVMIEWNLDSYKKRMIPTREELSTAEQNLRKMSNDLLSAPVYVAVLVDSKSRYPDSILYDGTLAAGYLMIAARALGYGTGFYTTFFPQAEMKEFFKIPEQYRLICFTPIGIPYEWPKTPVKKALEDLVVFEKF